MPLVLGDNQYKTDAPCHNRFGTLKNLNCSMALGAEHRSKFAALHRQWCRLQMTNSRVGRKTPNKKNLGYDLCFVFLMCSRSLWFTPSSRLSRKFSCMVPSFITIVHENTQRLHKDSSGYSLMATATVCIPAYITRISEQPFLTWLNEIYFKNPKQFYSIIVG